MPPKTPSSSSAIMHTTTDATTTDDTTPSKLVNLTQSTGDQINSESTKYSTTEYTALSSKTNQNNPNRIDTIGVNDELMYKEPCKRNQYNEEVKECNSWNKTICNSPCKNAKCPKFAKCHDISTETQPSFECRCQLGTQMKDDLQECIQPQVYDSTPRWVSVYITKSLVYKTYLSNIYAYYSFPYTAHQESIFILGPIHLCRQEKKRR